MSGDSFTTYCYLYVILIICCHLYRGESCSIASSDRKNRKRKRTNRKALGRRSDAIIRKNANGQTLEFGGSEVARFYNSKMGSKWLVESGLKLPKMLRDMFTALCDRVKWKTDIIQKLETVGYIHGGTQKKFSLFFLPLLNICLFCLYRTRYDVNVIGQSGWICYAPYQG